MRRPPGYHGLALWNNFAVPMLVGGFPRFHLNCLSEFLICIASIGSRAKHELYFLFGSRGIYWSYTSLLRFHINETRWYWLKDNPLMPHTQVDGTPHSNSTGNKGCLTQTLNLLVFTKMTDTGLDSGLATHLFTTMPSGRLWYSTCLTRHVVVYGKLLVFLRTDCCLLPIVTCPRSPYSLMGVHWA